MTTPVVWSSTSDQTLVIAIPSDVVCVQVRALAFTRESGFVLRDQWRVAIAASEAASNVIKFGAPGAIVFRRRIDTAHYVEFEVTDSGPGIDDLDTALRDSVSEGVDLRTREDLAPRRGLGCGLGAIIRLMDECILSSAPGSGTRLVARRWLR